MVTKAAIDQFFAQKKYAVVGVSRNKTKFGNTVYRELKTKGYQLYPVNTQTNKINHDPCYPDLKSIPEKVYGVITVIPPAETEKIVHNLVSLGIKQIWMQQGSETEKAIHFCQDNKINVIHGECILMFAEPVPVLHRIHRWVLGIIGKLPR